jgi:hypothetical protein
MPSFKPVEVEFVKQYEAFGGEDYGDLTVKGKIMRRDEIHPTKDVAINVGHERLAKSRAQIAKLQMGHDKKLEALEKARK